MAFNAGEVLIRIGLDDGDLQRKLDSAKGGLQSFSQQAQSIGTALSLGVTAPIVATGTAATKASIDINAAMANVATLIPGQMKLIESLKEEVQELAKEMGQTPVSMAEGLLQVVSSFPEAQEDTASAMEFLKTAARAAVAGVASTQDAVSLLASVIKGYGLSMADAAKIGDYAFRTADLGDTTFGELANSMGSVVPMAAALRVSQEDLWGAMATLTGVTGNTDAVVTQLRSTFKAIIDPTDTMAVALRGIGEDLIRLGRIDANDSAVVNLIGAQTRLNDLRRQYNDLLAANGGKESDAAKRVAKEISEQDKVVKSAGAAMGGRIVESEGLLSTLLMLRDTTAGNDVELANMLGRVEALNGVLALTGPLVEQMQFKTSKMYDVSGSTDVAYKEKVDGINKLGFSLAQFQQDITVVMQDLGDAIAPMVEGMLQVLKPLVDGIRDVIGAFKEAPSWVQGFVFKLVEIAAEAGPILLAVVAFTKLHGAISQLFTGPTGWIVLGVALLFEFGKAWIKAKEDQEHFYENSLANIKKFDEESSKLDTLLDQYEELSGKPKLSAEEHEKLRQVMDGIVAIQPKVTQGYKDAKSAIDANVGSLRNYAEGLKAASAAELSKAALKAQSDLPKAHMDRAKVVADIDAMAEKMGPGYQKAAQTVFYANKFETLVNEAKMKAASGVKPEEAYSRVLTMLKQDIEPNRKTPYTLTELLRVTNSLTGMSVLDLIVKDQQKRATDAQKQYGKNADAMINLEKRLAELDQSISEATLILEMWSKTKKDLGLHDGAVLPGSFGPDQYSAMLAPGEAVVPSRAVRGGPDAVFEWFRSVGVPGFAEGGVVPYGGPFTDVEAGQRQDWYDPEWRYWDEVPGREDFEPDPFLGELLSLEDWLALWGDNPPEEEVYWAWVDAELVRLWSASAGRPTPEYGWNAGPGLRGAFDKLWRYRDEVPAREDFEVDPRLADIMQLEEWMEQFTNPPEEEVYWDYVTYELERMMGRPDIDPLREFGWYVAHESLAKEYPWWRRSNWRGMLGELKGWLPGFQDGALVTADEESPLQRMLRQVQAARAVERPLYETWGMPDDEYAEWYWDYFSGLSGMGDDWTTYRTVHPFGFPHMGIDIPNIVGSDRQRQSAAELAAMAEEYWPVSLLIGQGADYRFPNEEEGEWQSLPYVLGDYAPFESYEQNGIVAQRLQEMLSGSKPTQDDIEVAALLMASAYRHRFWISERDKLVEDMPYLGWASEVGPARASYPEARFGNMWPEVIVHENAHIWQVAASEYAHNMDIPAHMLLGEDEKLRSIEVARLLGGDDYDMVYELEARMVEMGFHRAMLFAQALSDVGMGPELASLLGQIAPFMGAESEEILGAYRKYVPWIGFASGGMTGDIIPAMVAPGEAIVPAQTVAGGWPAVAAWFRSKGVPGFRDGGVIEGGTGRGMWDRVESAFVAAADTAKGTFQNLGSAMIDRMPIAKGMLGAAQQATPGNPWSMLVAVVESLITNSKVFNTIVQKVNPILQALADCAGALLEPLIPIVSVISATLTPVLDVIGTILSAVFLPLMQVLFPVIKLFGLVVLKVVGIIGHAWNAIAKAINWALGWLGVNLKLIDTAGLAESFRALQELTWEQAMQVESLNGALGNTPRLFKVATYRMEAADTVASSTRMQSSHSAGTASAGVTFVFQGDVYGWEDFKRRVQQANAEAGRPLSLARYGIAGAT